MAGSRKIIDLFAGGGGFSLGAHLAGFDTALAVDIDPILSSSFGLNFPGVPVEHWNLAETAPEAFAPYIGGERLAGIIGGPPCQAFSEIGRRVKTDARRDLIWHYFRLVAALRPAFFVMENVRGLGFPDNRDVLDAALEQVAGQYQIVGPVLLDASRFGAPTQRRRLFVFGFDRSEWDVPALDVLTASDWPKTNVHQAISDLAAATPAEGEDDGFDWWGYPGNVGVSEYAAAARNAPPVGLGSAAKVGLFSGHTRTRHTDAVKQRFGTILPGKQDPVGKHKRLDWDGLAPTLRAGTGNDRGSYQSVRPIHPSDNRVITVREGARLQGFPDWFVFHPTVWHSFRMIGNSVSPIISKAVLSWVAGERAKKLCYLDGAE